MSLFPATLPSFTIPIGDTVSNVLEWDKYCHDAEALKVISPAAYAETFTWEVSPDNTNWSTLNDITDTAIKVPGAGKSIVYNGVFTAIKYLRIKANGAVAAARTFQIEKMWRGARN